MYYYFQTTKSSGKSIYFRLGFNPKNEFEFYYSDNQQNWNDVEVVFIGDFYELKQKNSRDKVSFSFCEEAEELILNCNIERESRISFYNEKNQKASLANFYELRLVKIPLSSLPAALLEEKFSSDWERSSSVNDWITTEEELSFSPRRFKEEEEDSESEQSDEDSDDGDNCLNITMMTLGLLEAAFGGTSIAIAITLLKLKTTVGLVTTIVGGVVGLSGFGFFAAGVYRSCNEETEKPSQTQVHSASFY